MKNTETFVLNSGRRATIHGLAKGDRQTIVFCHSAPGAGNFNPAPEETAKRSVTLIAVDRPGYGESDPVTGDQWASVAVCADDLAEVVQSLNTDPVGVVGWSAGGRIALALAGRHPELVARVVILATPAPDEKVPWIPEEQKQGLEALRGSPPEEVHSRLGGQFSEMLSPNAPPEVAFSLLGRSPADEGALAVSGANERLTQMLKTAFTQGMAGMAADVAGYCLQPWGFEPANVKAKTLCLYGAQDPIAGSRHGSWWQKNLPDARLEMVPGAGHLLIIPMWHRVLSFLAPARR